MSPQVELKIIDADNNEVSIVIKQREITLNGVRYIPDNSQPTKVKIFLMKDNHSTIRIEGTNTKSILTNIKKTRLSDPDADIGNLFLMNEEKEIKRFNLDVKDIPSIEQLLNKNEVNYLLHTNTQ